MNKPWENDSCEHIQTYYTLYPVPVAAALWCGIPLNQVEDHLSKSVEVRRGIFQNPYIKCLEPRCRVINEAIDEGVIPVCRENGKSIDGSQEHVAPERRHVTRQNLKEWITREFPSDRPEFLFDEIERTTHTAINAETFRALQADRDALEIKLKAAKNKSQCLVKKNEDLERINQSLEAIVEKNNAPGERAEATYLNIIGSMLKLMLSKSPGGQSYSILSSQAAIISALLGHHENKPGISARTLEEKFAAAKRSLSAS